MSTIFTKPSESETADTKKNKEKRLQSSWELTYGHEDLVDLLLNERSRKFVIFEKTSNFITPPPKSKPGDLETKKTSERQQQQVLKVVLCRTEILAVNLNDPTGRSVSASPVSTGKSPVTIFMLFGDGHRINQAPKDKAYIAWKALDSSFLILCQITEMPLAHYICHFSFPPWEIRSKESWKNAQETAKFLKRPGSLDTDTFLGITTGDMSKHICTILFDTLKISGWYNTEDCEFLKKIVPFRKPSEKQEELSGQIERMVGKKNYQKAIELTKEMHKISRQEARKRGTSNVYINKNKNNMLEVTLIDDCNAAAKLGKHLEKEGLLKYAVEAFKILTDTVVEKTGKVSISYYTPYANKARSKIKSLQKLLIPSSPTIDSRREKQKEEITEENLTLPKDGDSSNTNLFLNSLEAQREFPSESDLFKGTDRKSQHEEILSKDLLLESESKQRAEIRGSQSSEAIQVSKSLSTSLQSLNSPEEEDDDDFPPPSSPPDPLLFSYPPGKNTSSPSAVRRSISSPFLIINTK